MGECLQAVNATFDHASIHLQLDYPLDRSVAYLCGADSEGDLLLGDVALAWTICHVYQLRPAKIVSTTMKHL